MGEDAREKLATLIYKTKPFLTGAQAKEIADAILAAYPQIAPPQDVVSGAHEKLAQFIRDNGFVGPDELAQRILAALPIPTAPTENVLAAAREIARTYSMPQSEDRCATAIAAFAAAHAERERAPILPRSCHALEFPTAADSRGVVLYFATPEEADVFSKWLSEHAAIRARKP